MASSPRRPSCAADRLTASRTDDGQPVASVLSLYHNGAVLPYWGGGTWEARRLRANDRMYYELMLHARRRGCTRFDFGRSKAGSGPYDFKRNWGFEPQPLSYASWTAPGARPRSIPVAVNADSLATWVIPALAATEGFLFDLVIDDQDVSQEWLKRGEVAAVAVRGMLAIGSEVQGG